MMGKKSPCLSCKHKNVYEPLTKCFVCNFSGIECKNFEMYKPNSKTNADRIRSMTDEELEDFLDRWALGDIDYSKTFCSLCDGQFDCHECRLDWLRKEIV